MQHNLAVCRRLGHLRFKRKRVMAVSAEKLEEKKCVRRKKIKAKLLART